LTHEYGKAEEIGPSGKWVAHGQEMVAELDWWVVAEAKAGETEHSLCRRNGDKLGKCESCDG